ncbi:MAG: hypothetical protein IJT50_07040 [Lentisphaeria bacterium]|nr:hypothetical protein [Lentisphaeria bacterium]
MKKECAGKFGELPVIRDFETCRQCRFLFHEVWGNNGYMCANTPRSFGHPWCRESREPVSKEDFEKVHIYILNEKECLCK